MKVVIAEKPSVARDIAAFLGAKKRCDGYYDGGRFCVTWAFGHLVTLKDPAEYDPKLKRWSVDVLPIVPETFKLKIVDNPGVSKQFAVIKRLFCAADELICATDAGREGELIFRYILTMTKCEDKPFRRLWLSSLTEEAIGKAFKNLRPGSDYDNLYYAARCRSESDWIVGLNATRNMTVRFGGGKVLWSVGRVQTPVLSMIARRDDTIRNFKSELFWEVFTKFRDVDFKHKGKRFKTETDAQSLVEKIKGHGFLIEKVASKKEKVQPPLLFDLTDLQREMNKRHGMSAAETLKVAQNLYEQKAITYPRTDSRYLTADMKREIPGILRSLQNGGNKDVAALDLKALKFSTRIVNDKKVSDHHALIPTGKSIGNLPQDMKNVYDAIATRLIAVFYPQCLKEHTTVDGKTAGKPFVAKGVVVLSQGWTVLYPKKDDGEEPELPVFLDGESGNHEPYVKEGKTKPPRYFTENSLLGAMETAGNLVDDELMREALKDKGIGTPATRAAIIEILIKRKYIERVKKRVTATDLGRYLVALIQDPNLKSPELTGDWEAQLKEVEHGTMDSHAFMEKIVSFTKDVIKTSDVCSVDTRVYGPCPKCGSAVIKGNRGFGCSNWKKGCDFVIWFEYEGVTLDDMQVRKLLQKRIMLQNITLPGKGKVILALSDDGTVMDIPLPIGNRR